MNKFGIVEKNENGKVTIRIQRDSSCGENCAMCNACSGKNMLITLDTNIPLSTGDTVKLETNTKYVMISAFLVYILPILLLIIGYAIFTLYIGFSLMTVSFIVLFFIDKKISTNRLIKLSKVH